MLRPFKDVQRIPYQRETLGGEADLPDNDRGVIFVTDCECARQEF
jgi:hypothetical protein